MTSPLQPVEDWYDDPEPADLVAGVGLPLTIPFTLPSRQAATETVSTGESFDRLDQSRVPTVTGGLPIDVNVANLLAGDFGLITKPEVGGQIAPAFDGIKGIIDNIFSGWFGANPDESTPVAANYTIRAIKDAILNGYIVSTYTSSGMFTVTDQMTELVVICVGGGANGTGGAQPTAGKGGLCGGYQVYTLDVAEILGGAASVSVPVTVGTAGNKTSFGSFAESSPGVGGISTTFGWSPTSSTPGNGGDGGLGGQAGSYNGANGQPGGSTAVAAGGSAGTGGNVGARNGGIGGHGVAADPAALVKCCGSGGAGGGGGYSTDGLVAYSGGAGGNGGYPGGGAGGGGGKGAGVGTGSPGGGGYGAPGVFWAFRKELA